MTDDSTGTRVVDLLDVTDHPDSSVPAIPAATVLLVRDARGSSGLEVLMIERGQSTSFGGMWAFPGGVIELDDIPEGSAPDPLPAARCAAARETVEEVGLRVDPADMVWWSHWVPPEHTPAPKRFSTWFLLSPAGVEHADELVAVDGHEVRMHRWLRPDDAINSFMAGEFAAVAPTIVTLVDLARRTSVDHAVATAKVEHFATRIVSTDDGRWCIWHGDAAYNTGDVNAPGARNRMLIEASTRHLYERSYWP